MADPNDVDADKQQIIDLLLTKSPYTGVTFESLLAHTGQALVFKGIFQGNRCTAHTCWAFSLDPATYSTPSSYGCRVALKLFLDAAGPDFERECMVLKSLPPHPNVVPLLHCFQKPWPCAVLPFIEGGDLEMKTRRDRPFKPDEARLMGLGT
jgi:serine/threonine protein kinase